MKKRADTLVQIARLNAIESFVPISDKFPKINELFKSKKVDEWDFFVTIAGVATAIANLDDNLPVSTIRDLIVRIQNSLDEWDPNGNRALTDIGDFITRNTGQGVDHHIAVGSWVLWNIKGEEPNDSELDLAPTIGGFLSGSFSDWWVG